MDPTLPTLLLDMDGPLADFDAKMIDFCDAQGIELDFSKGWRRFLTDNIPDKRGANRLRNYINDGDNRWFRDLPVTPGAIDGVYELMDYFDVWVCTKPLEACHSCRDDKAAWISRYLPELTDKLFCAPDKGMIKGDILLDDAPKHKWFTYAEWRPVVFKAPYNGEGTKWEGLPSWTWGDPLNDLLRWVPGVPIWAV